MGPYIDSNIFIYAFTNNEDKGGDSRAFLKRVREGKEVAITSAATFAECFFVIKKLRGFEEAIEFSKALINMPNLKIADTALRTAIIALELLQKYETDPTDAIHAATAIQKGCESLYSYDSDFKLIKEIEHRTPETYR